MGSIAPDELRALSRLAFAELARAPAGIGDVHRAIADRAFGAVGPGAAPSRALHDAVATGVYAALRGTAAAAGMVADGALARRSTRGRPISATPRGAAALGALNGLIGDELARDGSALEQRMSLRGVPRTQTPRLVVFVHGLFETELAWGFGGGPSYGERLAADAGFSPLTVRFNSGLHISENGLLLADLLAATFDDWPRGRGPDRARRPLAGRPGGAQRLPPGG